MFVIPDKRSADPEPMPLAVVQSKHCNNYAFHPANSAVRTIEAWIPDIAAQFRDDENFEDKYCWQRTFLSPLWQGN